MVRIDPTGPRSSYRLFEWTMALAIFGIGALLLFYPQAMVAGSRFAPFGIATHQPSLMMACITIGVVRGAVLFMNGQLGTYSARFRAILAFLSLTIWSQLCVALILNGGVPSIGIPVFAALAVGEVRSIWRAARDCNGFYPGF